MKEKYNLQYAVNHSYDVSSYFIGKCHNYLIVIANLHISVWEKVDGEWTFSFNLMHEYNLPNFVNDTENRKLVIEEAPVNFILLENTIGCSFLNEFNLGKLTYKKVIDRHIPQNIQQWKSLMDCGTSIYDKLGVLKDDCGFADESGDLMMDVFDSLFITSDLGRTRGLIEQIESFYTATLLEVPDEIFR